MQIRLSNAPAKSSAANTKPWPPKTLSSVTNLIARLLYGCGLRVCEPLNLRIKDIDLQRRQLCIRGAKGGKDRVVSLPLSLIPELTIQMERARKIWQLDSQDATPIMLPHRLVRNLPSRFKASETGRQDAAKCIKPLRTAGFQPQGVSKSLFRQCVNTSH
jgi:integrase